MSRTQMKHSSKSNSKRNDYSGSQVIFAGNWGQWLPLQTAPAGSFLCGILYNHSLDSPKENQVGVDGVVAVFCNAQNWKTQKEETCAEKSFGDYRKLMCPEGSYVAGVFVKQLPPQGTFHNDDGIEQIGFNCYNPYTLDFNSVFGLNVEFGEDVYQSQSKFWTALQVRYDGGGMDPTGTNGMAGSFGEFKCNDGYLLQYNIQCFKALDNCKADKQSADKCSECNDGFLLFDSACYKTITQCVTQDKEKCTKCSCGHFLNYDDLCYQKLDNCDKQIGNYCYTCIDFMTTSTIGKCIQQIANCAEQQDAFCAVCDGGFTLVSNVCVKKDVVEGCGTKAPVKNSRRQKSLKIKSNKNVKRNKVNSKRLSMRN